jgi:hypothetical protein
MLKIGLFIRMNPCPSVVDSRLLFKNYGAIHRDVSARTE